MARTLGALRFVAALGLIGACGGNPFVLDGGAGDGGPNETGGPQNAGVVPPTGAVYCGSAATCGALKPICCTGVTTGTSCADNPAGCGCVTRLACASDGNCSAAQPICCIRSTPDPSCGSSVLLATCSLACTLGGTRLCDPNAATPGCPGNKGCSTDSGSLQAVGLPEGQGFGVCK
jgi:hypothetical protein